MDEDRIADIWGARTPHAAGTAWPERVDRFLSEGVTEAGVDSWVRSACLLCSNGCGLEIAVAGGRIVGVRGRGEDRVSHGRLGPKGLYGWQGEQRERLTMPLIREGCRLVETGWNTAMSRVAAVSVQRVRACPGAHHHRAGPLGGRSLTAAAERPRCSSHGCACE